MAYEHLKPLILLHSHSVVHIILCFIVCSCVLSTVAVLWGKIESMSKSFTVYHSLYQKIPVNESISEHDYQAATQKISNITF